MTVIGLPSSREGGQGRELPLDALDVVPVRRDHGLGELRRSLLQLPELLEQPVGVHRARRVAVRAEPHLGHERVALGA